MKKILFISLGLFILFPGLCLATDINLSEAEKFIAESAGDQAGISVSSAGDVNNDGYDDIIVGAYMEDEGGDAAGAAYIIYGSDSLISSTNLDTADVKFIGEAAGDRAGISVSSAGDVNNDGYDDVIVGAYMEDTGDSGAGAAYIIYGSDSLAVSIDLSLADVKLIGEEGNDFAGRYVSSAGNVNNDDYDDVIVGATQEDTGGGSAGAAYIIYGSDSLGASIDLSAADVKLIGEAASDGAGTGVSSAGNVNNDGYDDVIVGAYQEDTGGSAAGAAYIIYGSDSLAASIDLSLADVKLIGETAGDMVSPVSVAGDVNKDGYDDVIVGANGESSSTGAAYIIYGSDSLGASIDLSAADVKLSGEAAMDNAGCSVSSAGDVNADGYDDVLIGARLESTGAMFAGAAYIIYGSDSLAASIELSAADIKLIGESGMAGRSVASIDVNNDGYDDILVGAENESEGGHQAGAAYLGYLNVDADGDGVTASTGLISGTDCDDADATISATQSYFVDSDEDNYGSTTAADVCSLTAPTGYASNATDCDDTDDTVNANQTYYVDADEDGYGSTTTAEVCALTAPTGYSTNATDCDDEDDTVNENQTYYLDNDGDGLGDPDESVSVCSATAPDGYVTNADDDDDTGEEEEEEEEEEGEPWETENQLEDIAAIENSSKGQGQVQLKDENDEVLCTIDAWPKGGAVGKFVRFLDYTYIAVVKNRYGRTTHLYNLDCELVVKKKLSPKTHPRRFVVRNFLAGSNSQEIAISSRRGSTAYVKLFRYNPVKDEWYKLKTKSFRPVKTNYTLDKNKKGHVLIKQNENVKHRWKIRKKTKTNKIII